MLVSVMLPISCEKDEQKDSNLPTVEIINGTVGVTGISFTISPKNATDCSYLVFEKTDGETPKDAVYILENGVPLDKIEEKAITVNDLKSETTYYVMAAVKDAEDKTAVSAEVDLTTTKGDALISVVVTLDEKSTTSFSFTVTPTNAGECKYLMYKKGDGMPVPDENQIIAIGDEVSAIEPTKVSKTDLIDNTTYVIYAAVGTNFNYDRVPAIPLEITTEKFTTPEELPIQSYTAAEFKVLRDRNYLLSMDNESYSIELDLYGAETPDYAPMIPDHEYVYVKEYNGGGAWTVDNYTKITDKATGKLLVFNKGTVTTKYTNGTYVITGELFTNDNKAFNFKYEGILVYPISGFTTGTMILDNGIYKITFGGNENYLYGLHLNEALVAGEFGLENGKLNATSFIQIAGGAKYSFTEAKVMVANESEKKYTFSTVVKTIEGYLMNITSKADLDDIVVPDPDYTFTSVTAASYDDGSGYGIYYNLEFKADGLTRSYIELHEQGYGDAIPAGTYIYSPSSSSGLGTATAIHMEVSAGNYYDFTDGGNVKVTKDGSIYTIVLTIPLADGRTFNAKYVGAISVEDNTIPYLAPSVMK